MESLIVLEGLEQGLIRLEKIEQEETDDELNRKKKGKQKRKEIESEDDSETDHNDFDAMMDHDDGGMDQINTPNDSL